jgi:hypothetical protein
MRSIRTFTLTSNGKINYVNSPIIELVSIKLNNIFMVNKEIETIIESAEFEYEIENLIYNVKHKLTTPSSYINETI